MAEKKVNKNKIFFFLNVNFTPEITHMHAGTVTTTTTNEKCQDFFF